MKRIISGILVLIIAATSFCSAQLNRGVPLDNAVSRIVNGELATDGQFPYLVRMMVFARLVYIDCVFEEYQCGGSIIAKNWILTAGHCTKPPPKANGVSLDFLGWQIEAGEIIANEPRQRRIVLLADVYPHPNYNSTTKENDLGLIYTAVPFDFSTPYVKPIHLVAANVNKASYVGDVATTSGFGFLTTTGPLPTQLYYTNLTVIDYTLCDWIYVYINEGHIPSTVICAANVINNSATCFGDSGGPLTILKNGKLIQIGIVSFVSGIGCNGIPNGFTDVTEFIPWIQKMIHGKYKY